MTLNAFKIIHLVGLILLFQSLGATIFARLSMPDQAGSRSNRMLMMMHGIGLFFLLIGGIGMLVQLEIPFPFPIWTWLKMTVWLALGAAPGLIRKRPQSARKWWLLVILLGALAASLGLFKPF